jgi:hypothetical protein
MSTWNLNSDQFPSLLPMEGRSPGVHISDVISTLSGYDRSSPPTNRQSGRMQLGCAFEHAIIPPKLESALDRALTHRVLLHEHNLTPGWELEKDNIFGTFDALDYHEPKTTRYGLPKERLNDRIVEVKLTWMRTPDYPSGWPDSTLDDVIAWDSRLNNWRTQLQSYCHMYGTCLGRLIAGFVLPSGECDWRDWSVQFEQVELELNWAKIKSVADLIRTTPQGNRTND